MSIKRFSVTLAAALLLSACSMDSYHHSVELATLADPTQALDRLNYQNNHYRAQTQYEFDKDQAALTTLKKAFRHNVEAQWGTANSRYSQPKIYVKYTNNYRTRTIVDFSQGMITVETLETVNPKQHLKQAMEYVLLAPEAPNYTDFYTAYTSAIQGTPFLYHQVRDQDGKLIKWHWRAARYANHIIAKQFKQTQREQLKVSAVSFKLVAGHTKIRAQKYQSLIATYAKRHGVDKNLVKAIIKEESLFNAYAMSAGGRIGLMQISPEILGKDVFTRLKHYPFYPGEAYLFNSSNNLDIGAGYLKLLQTHNLKTIKDPTSRYYCTLASYIAGPQNMLQTFSKDKTDAVNIINGLSSYEVYQSLTTKQSLPEIKDYVYKVNSHYRKYSR